MPGLDARRSGTRASPLANFRVDRSSPVPGRARPQGRERPGQAQPHLPGSTLRSPRTKLCGLSVSEPARCSVPAALGSGKAALPSSRFPVDPGRSPAAGDEGRGQPGPTPASHRAAPPTRAQPLSGFLLQSLSVSPLPALFFGTRPVTLCQRMSAVKCLWTLKSSVLFLTQRLRSSGPSGLYCSNYQALL